MCFITGDKLIAGKKPIISRIKLRNTHTIKLKISLQLHTASQPKKPTSLKFIPSTTWRMGSVEVKFHAFCI